LREGGGDNAFVDMVPPHRIIHQRIEDRCQLGVARLAAGDVTIPGAAVGQLHDTPRHGHFTEIETSAGSADAPADHHQSGFQPAQEPVVRFAVEIVPCGLQCVGRGTREHTYPCFAVIRRRCFA